MYAAILLASLSIMVHETAPDFSNMAPDFPNITTYAESFRLELRSIYREIFFVSLFLSFASMLLLGAALMQKRTRR